MTAAGDADNRSAFKNPWLRQLDASIRASMAMLLRAPRHRIAAPTAAQVVWYAVAAIVAVLAAMAVLDAWAVEHARRLPLSLLDAASRFTDIGKSQWFLWPIAIALLQLALIDTPAMPRFSRQILAAWAVRLEFVFAAIALPGLFFTIIKRLIGRSRPFVDGMDVWAYHPLSWTPKFASFPSGHTVNVFAVLVALGAIFPQARGLLWIYAILIGLSRVVIWAHYPSDVIAGAIVGTAGALLVRDWFAARGLGFLVRPDGSVKAMPGPSLRRITKAVARRLHSA
jgi:membrane-associated phospholipid phosphatase